MTPSFFSRKRGHQSAPSVRPPQTQTLDIAAISLLPSSAGANRSYLGTYRPDESMVSPPTSPDACTTIPPSQQGLGQAPSDFANEPSLLPGIEKLGVRSPSGSPIHKPRVPSAASLQSGSYHGALQGSPVPGLPTHAQHYHHRGSSSSSLSSYDSYMLDELDEPIEHSSAATTASSRSARSSRQRDWLKDVPEASTPRILSPATYSHQEPQLPTQPVSLSDHQPRASPNNPAALSDSPALSYPARRTSSRYNLADFHFVRTLGTGSFGRVHLVRSRHNNQHYAMKVLHKAAVVQTKQVEHTNSERDMLERVRHPFLINLWGTFKDCRNLYMVMDFVPGGELFSLLRRSRRFPDPVAKFFAAEVALALDYLHSLDIIYRDLKPENILLSADGHIKITDFGFAKYVPDITWTLCGTPDYLAPEIVQSRGYNKSVDWYAMGVLIFEMLAGYPPFFSEDPNPMRLYERIIAGGVRYPSHLTLDAKDLLQNLLTPDLTQRYGNLAGGSQDIFAHSWFAEVDWEHLYKKETPAPYVPRILGEGDASCFETYKEIDISTYGQPAEDPHGHLFDRF